MPRGGRRDKVRVSHRAAEHFETIVAEVAAGAPITATCRRHGLILATLRKYAFADPDRRARYEAATAGRNAGQQKRAGAAAKHFDEVLRRIEAGASFDAACRDTPGCPSRKVFYDLLRQDHAKLKQLNAAFCARSKAGDGRARFRPEQYDRALELLKSRPAETVEQVLNGRDPAIPAAWQVRHRARSRDDFGARFAEVMRRRAAMGSAQKCAAPDDLHQRSLSQNELHALAASCVPRGVDPEVRSDMIAEIVVSLIDGTIRPDELKSRKREITRDAHARVGPRTYVSLDAAGPYGRRLVDSLSSDQWIPA